MLALHGWPQHWWSWRHVIAELGGEFRVLCPDLRGFGWSGPPADDDFRKQRMADDAIALLDALGLEQVRLVGHDWGAWSAIVAALTAPERFSSLLAMSIGHPWVPTKVAARNCWRLGYQLPLAAPFVGERVIRDGRFVRGMLAAAAATAAGGPTRSSRPTSRRCASRRAHAPVAALPRLPHPRAARRRRAARSAAAA